MVSKVAVIAMVAIVACPILLGYGMNLSETTITDYAISGDSVNVTPLLQNDVVYTSVAADTYAINSSFSYITSPDNSPTTHPYLIPVYEKTTSVSSSLPLAKNMGTIGVGVSASDNLSDRNIYYVIWDYGSNGYVQMTFYSGSTPLGSASNVTEVYYDYNADSITYVSNNTTYTISGGNYTSWTWNNNSGHILHNVWGYQKKTNNTSFADISAGFHLIKSYNTSYPAVDLPANTKKVIFTINLDSITDANYNVSMNFVKLPVNPMKLVKTTTNGIVTWQYYRGSTLMADLYYDPNRSDNTYQISFTLDDPYQYGTNNVRYDTHTELKYVGGWPALIGIANAYKSYSFDGGIIVPNTHPGISGLGSIYFKDMTSIRTPVMRMDYAWIDGFEVNIISDQTYSPAAFKSNPATTLNNITIYGKSIQFGGNSYDVDESGNITIGTHKFSLNGIVFDSIPVSGGYENRINNAVISTTSQPSDISFIGNWAASVTTASMESNSYTHTEWTPGQFGWDGIDQNFLMVGLLTSIGVFIALGIYMRRTKAALWPLLVVCGGAAVLFFIML